MAQQQDCAPLLKVCLSPSYIAGPKKFSEIHAFADADARAGKSHPIGDSDSQQHHPIGNVVRMISPDKRDVNNNNNDFDRPWLVCPDASSDKALNQVEIVFYWQQFPDKACSMFLDSIQEAKSVFDAIVATIPLHYIEVNALFSLGKEDPDDEIDCQSVCLFRHGKDQAVCDECGMSVAYKKPRFFQRDQEIEFYARHALCPDCAFCHAEDCFFIRIHVTPIKTWYTFYCRPEWHVRDILTWLGTQFVPFIGKVKIKLEECTIMKDSTHLPLDKTFQELSLEKGVSIRVGE